MAGIGLFKLMIILVICMLGGVQGYKLYKINTKADEGDILLGSLLRTRCAIILEASFELEVAYNQDYSVIWDTSLNNMPSSKLAIGLQKHHLIGVLEEAGFFIQPGSTAHEVKMCRYVWENVEACKSGLLSKYEYHTEQYPESRFIYSPTETVVVTTLAGLPWKMEFQNLSWEEKEELLFDRYMWRAKMIAGWQTTTAEHHFQLYETASINMEIAKCLDKWRENVLYRDSFCTTAALLAATRANHLSFKGENACLSTVESSYIQVDAGPGLELTTSRDHRMVIFTDSYVGVTILGLPYLLQFPRQGWPEGFVPGRRNKKRWPKGFIVGDSNKKNSLTRLANYSDLDEKLFSSVGILSISYKREILTIAGDQHNQAHEYQQFGKNDMSNVTAQIMKLKQLN